MLPSSITPTLQHGDAYDAFTGKMISNKRPYTPEEIEALKKQHQLTGAPINTYNSYESGTGSGSLRDRIGNRSGMMAPASPNALDANGRSGMGSLTDFYAQNSPNAIDPFTKLHLNPTSMDKFNQNAMLERKGDIEGAGLISGYGNANSNPYLKALYGRAIQGRQAEMAKDEAKQNFGRGIPVNETGAQARARIFGIMPDDEDNIKKEAKGGPVKVQPYIVNEKGMESYQPKGGDPMLIPGGEQTFFPPVDGKIIPHDKTMEMMKHRLAGGPVSAGMGITPLFDGSDEDVQKKAIDRNHWWKSLSADSQAMYGPASQELYHQGVINPTADQTDEYFKKKLARRDWERSLSPEDMAIGQQAIAMRPFLNRERGGPVNGPNGINMRMMEPKHGKPVGPMGSGGINMELLKPKHAEDGRKNLMSLDDLNPTVRARLLGASVPDEPLPSNQTPTDNPYDEYGLVRQKGLLPSLGANAAYFGGGLYDFLHNYAAKPLQHALLGTGGVPDSNAADYFARKFAYQEPTIPETGYDSSGGDFAPVMAPPQAVNTNALPSIANGQSVMEMAKSAPHDRSFSNRYGSGSITSTPRRGEAMFYDEASKQMLPASEYFQRAANRQGDNKFAKAEKGSEGSPEMAENKKKNLKKAIS